MKALATLPPTDTSSAPKYEIRAQNHGTDDLELEIWQIPSSATPHIQVPVRVAGLRGRNLALIEHRVARRLKKQGDIELAGIPVLDRKAFVVSEGLALHLGLLFRVLAPMKDRDNMRACVEGIEEMGPEEAAYWLGMAMHRKHPRRVLFALRVLLTEPRS